MDEDKQQIILRTMLRHFMIMFAVRTMFLEIMFSVVIYTTKRILDRPSRKRKRRSSYDAVEVLIEALKESSSNLDKSMMEFAKSLYREFGEIQKESGRRLGHIDLDRAKEVFKQLMSMRDHGLTWSKINKAHIKINESPSLIVAFPLLVPKNHMLDWVRSLLE